jgi:CRISPR/Cas system CSM-associated protein Csm3 (group 7 of RAMP superfamily)
MTYDFYTEIWAEKKKILENEMNKIRNLRGSTKKQEARRNLPEIFKRVFSRNWYSRIKEISLFAKYYEGREEKDLLKIGYNGYFLDCLTEMDNSICRMNDEWFLNKEDESTIFGLISSPRLNLPIRYSTFLHVKFILQKPYISKDDEEFYIHDNPVSKEKVFKVPYIRASSWKGNLLWAAKIANDLCEDDEKILRIFGNKKGEEDQEKLKKGRLYTYPTFFDRISLDIINPHDRETRTGKNPITLEIVPEDTEGDLYLLYVPFDKIDQDENNVKQEIKEDLLIICKAVEALLTDFGISAKRTSGYGTARIGKIKFKSELLKEFEKYTDFKGLLSQLDNESGKSTSTSHRGENR